MSKLTQIVASGVVGGAIGPPLIAILETTLPSAWMAWPVVLVGLFCSSWGFGEWMDRRRGSQREQVRPFHGPGR